MSGLLVSLRGFAHEHDDVPAFHATYLVMTFIAAAMFNVGAFGVLIIIHMVLDFVKYKEVHHFSAAKSFRGMIHESLVDVTLFMVALVFSVYFHHSVGLVTVSGLMRAEFSLMRAIGTIIPKAVILEHFLKVMAHMHHYLQQIHPHMRHDTWTFIDKLYMVFTAFALLLLLAAPSIMGVSSDVIQMVIWYELVPWNF